MKTKIIAVPELLVAGKWKIKPTLSIKHTAIKPISTSKETLEICPTDHPEVNITEFIYKAPMGESKEDLAIRMHEYAHLAYSPKKMPYWITDPLMANAVQAAEDCRINKKLVVACRKSTKLIDSLGSIGYKGMPELFKEMKTSLKDVKASCDGLSKFSTDEVGVEIHIISLNLLGITSMILTRIALLESGEHELKPALKQVERLIKICAKSYSTIFNKEYLRNITYIMQEYNRGYAAALSFDSYTINLAKALFRLILNAPLSEDLPHKGRYLNKEGVSTFAINDSGSLLLKDAMRNGVTKLKSKHQKLEIGMHLREPHRYITDGLCFTEKTKKPYSGTVLIDCSGSMNIDLEILKEVVEKSAGITLAAYSGEYDKGTLWILSKGRQICTELPIFKQGNVIDYPALLWMLEQRKPYFWVCDGCVTGIDDRLYTSITNACNDLLKKNKISVFTKLQDFYKEFTGKPYIQMDEKQTKLKKRLEVMYG